MSTITMNGLVKVSIPQAVSTVATCNLADLVLDYRSGFNTASGKYCCNFESMVTFDLPESFNTASGKYCCNLYSVLWRGQLPAFQYRKR